MNRNSFENIIIRNSNRNSTKKIIGNISLAIWGLIYLVILFLVSYITTMTIKYLTTDCLKKKNYFRYLIGFNYKNVCVQPPTKVIANINIKDLPSSHSVPSFPKLDLDKIIENSKKKEDENKKDKDPRDNIPIANHSATTVSSRKNPSVEYELNKLKEKPQVFHIANQDYSYEQAKCKCASYNAKLANYSQIVDAYNKGAEWCSYGWTEGQAAYYPTQKCNWLKKTDEEKKACGKPGINGGFFGDPNLKFGVNCYGKKPQGKMVKMIEKECDYCEVQQNYSASHRLDTDEIVPFNDKQWAI